MGNHNSTFNSIDELQHYLLDRLFSEGEFITTREQKTLEICNVNLCLSNPRNRRTYNPVRKWKFPLALGEFAWHISGSKNLDFITYYARQWKDFSSDGISISQSCYGHKIFGLDSIGESQWSRLIKLLKKDKFSRRAVLDFYDSNNGIDYSSKDIACVCTAQFLIRNEKLDIIVTMRSNDIIWGLPYDIYLFSMLQELLSIELEIELGRYYHNVGSMHIYEKHFEFGKNILKQKVVKAYPEDKMPSKEFLQTFLNYEEKIREKNVSIDEIEKLSIEKYWKDLLIVLLEYKN